MTHPLAPWKVQDDLPFAFSRAESGVPVGECYGRGVKAEIAAAHIVRCVNEMAELENLARDPRVSSEALGNRIRNNLAR